MNKNKIKEYEIIESLADLEHEQWMHWAKAVIKEGFVPEAKVKQWEKLFIPYKQLTEEAKEHDRYFARKVYERLAEIWRRNA